ncbi:transposase [Pectobacterium carotovorum]|uniref:Tn3 family transposase n=1 Tax=Pectobacterium carotovorum TaxID=554 RepID=UPI00191D222E|nr:Tn3 family transposase [Pectobacterium carotovorum]MBL0865421.1 transposase [Pectobacterium carotovorum]
MDKIIDPVQKDKSSANRIESWHQLRSAIAQVGGKKELTGQNDVELEISNQCGRLLSIHYRFA